MMRTATLARPTAAPEAAPVGADRPAADPSAARPELLPDHPTAAAAVAPLNEARVALVDLLAILDAAIENAPTTRPGAAGAAVLYGWLARGRRKLELIGAHLIEAQDAFAPPAPLAPVLLLKAEAAGNRCPDCGAALVSRLRLDWSEEARRHVAWEFVTCPACPAAVLSAVVPAGEGAR